jgi:hypothetical protein
MVDERRAGLPMSDAAPPPWVRRLTKAEHGVDAGVWRLLVTAWGFGPYQRRGPVEADGTHAPAKPVVIWASVEALAEESGQPAGTVKDQLRRAARAGWIRRDKGARMTLAWREPGCFDYGSRTADRPNRTVHRPDGPPTKAAGLPTCPDGPPTQDRTAHRPQTFHGTSNSTSTDLGPAARASDEPSPDLRVPLPDGHRLQGQRPARPQPDREPSEALVAAVKRHGGQWLWQLESEPWRRTLAEAEADLELRPEHVEAALAAWDRQAEGGVKSGQPHRSAIWYRRSRRWLREAAGMGAEVVPLRGAGRSLGRRAVEGDAPTIEENRRLMAEARAARGQR